MGRRFVYLGVVILCSVSGWASISGIASGQSELGLLQEPPADVTASIAVRNGSFEAPTVDPNGFGAWPFIDGWLEFDLDTQYSTNTGVFLNTAVGSPDRLVNADGLQLAFLGAQQGNALEQDLAALYRIGCTYRLTVGVGVSARFPPSSAAPADTLKMVLYYLDGNEPVDIVQQVVEPNGLSCTQLKDFSVLLPAVRPGDAWAGKTIGIALRAAGRAGGFWDLDNVRLVESLPTALAVANASFEAPVVDPNGFGAGPFMDGWLEVDLDAQYSTNTGVFLNTPLGSPDHLTNADGKQLAFLGSQKGNSLEQDLTAVYQVGCSYRLTAGVGVSARFPPSAATPKDTLEIVLYYLDGNEPVDVVHQTIGPNDLSSTHLQDFSVYLGTVQPGDVWAGRPIGIALRATGKAGGFWDLDNVRLAESLPVEPPAPANKE
jgi:hypothetical protein